MAQGGCEIDEPTFNSYLGNKFSGLKKGKMMDSFFSLKSEKFGEFFLSESANWGVFLLPDYI